LIQSESINPTADGRYVIIGTNTSGGLVTSADIARDYGSKYLAIEIQKCGNSTPETNSSCNWGYKGIGKKFSAILDSDGNVIEYNPIENATSSPDLSSTIRPKTGYGIFLNFSYEERQQNKKNPNTGRESGVSIGKIDPDGSILWESRVNLGGNAELSDHLWTLKIDQVLPTSDNGYLILANIDKNRI
jgi:hypothetical protein